MDLSGDRKLPPDNPSPTASPASQERIPKASLPAAGARLAADLPAGASPHTDNLLHTALRLATHRCRKDAPPTDADFFAALRAAAFRRPGGAGADSPHSPVFVSLPCPLEFIASNPSSVQTHELDPSPDPQLLLRHESLAFRRAVIVLSVLPIAPRLVISCISAFADQTLPLRADVIRRSQMPAFQCRAIRQPVPCTHAGRCLGLAL